MHVAARMLLIVTLALPLFSLRPADASAKDATPSPSDQSSGTLAFSSGGDIYVVNVDGTGLARLTDDPAADFDPTWSPDGSMIAFRSTRDGNDEIYVMNADGSNQRNLTNDPAEDWSPAWSPDGSKIAYATFAFGGTFQGNPYTDIATITLDGRERTRLTEAHGEYPEWSPDGSQIAFTSGRDGSYDIWVMNADGGNQRNLTDDPAYESSATWSPDGSRIAFDAERGEDRDREPGIGFEFDLWVMDADGSNQTALTSDPASEDRFPAWSRDDRIAFNRNGMLHVVNGDGTGLTAIPGTIDGQFPAWRPAVPPERELTGRIAFSDDINDIWVVNADGSGLHQLTTDPAHDFDPSWSPDGTRIAFRSNRSGEDDIWVMNADGSGQTNLTNHPAEDISPAWSPDGSRIAFASDREGPAMGIWVMNADGSNPQRLGDVDGEYPAWSPDGTKIAFDASSGEDWDIYIMNVDGTGLTRLTDSSAADQGAAWSPDGMTIAFASSRDQTDERLKDIYVVNADGSNVRRLTHSGGDRPVWSPNGRHVLFHWGGLYVMSADGSDVQELPISGLGELALPDWTR